MVRGLKAAAEEVIKVGEDLGVHVQGCAPIVRYLQRVVGVRDFHEGTGSFSLSAPVPERIGRSADQKENGHLAVAGLGPSMGNMNMNLNRMSWWWLS